METILIGLAAAGATILIAPLAVVAAGIRRQEHAGSLTARPSGPAAALTRKLLALHAEPLPGSTLNGTTPRKPPAAPARRDPARTAAIAPQAQS